MFKKIFTALPIVLATVAMSGVDAKAPSPSLASASYYKEDGQNVTIGATYRYALARQGNTLVGQVMSGNINVPDQLQTNIYDAGSTYHSMFSVKAEMLMPERDFHFTGITYDWLYAKQNSCYCEDCDQQGTVYSSDFSVHTAWQDAPEEFTKLCMKERDDLNDIQLYYGRNSKMSRRFAFSYSGFVEIVFGRLSNQLVMTQTFPAAQGLPPVAWTTDNENNLFYAGPGVRLMGEFYLREGTPQGAKGCCSRVALYAGCAVSGVSGTSQLTHHSYQACQNGCCDTDYTDCHDRVTEAKTRGWKPVIETRMGISINPAMEDDNGLQIMIGFWGRSYIGLGDWIRYNNHGGDGAVFAVAHDIENVVNIPQYDVNYSGIEVAFSYSF